MQFNCNITCCDITQQTLQTLHTLRVLLKFNFWRKVLYTDLRSPIKPADGATKVYKKWFTDLALLWTGGQRKRCPYLLKWAPTGGMKHVCSQGWIKETFQIFWSSPHIFPFLSNGRRERRVTVRCWMTVLTGGQWVERGDRGGWDRLNSPCNAC